MAKFISELSNEKAIISYDDYFLADNPVEGKTFKMKGSAFVPRKIDFVDPAAVWAVIHELGRFPIVQCFDLDNYQIDGQIHHKNDQEVEILFNQNVAGYVLIM